MTKLNTFQTTYYIKKSLLFEKMSSSALCSCHMVMKPQHQQDQLLQCLSNINCLINTNGVAIKWHFTTPFTTEQTGAGWTAHANAKTLYIYTCLRGCTFSHEPKTPASNRKKGVRCASNHINENYPSLSLLHCTALQPQHTCSARTYILCPNKTCTFICANPLLYRDTRHLLMHNF